MIVKTSPAKINLFLKVLRKREDGYHDILTLMQKISLCDEIAFSLAGKGIVLHCPGSGLPEDENNLALRAAQRLLSDASRSPGVEITIRKNIPVAAGLGGGSSNAATVLLTLNELMEFHYSREKLMRMGAELGADVPFFIYGRTAWASGIGDRFQPADEIPPLWFVLVNPGFELSTREVYEGLKLGLTNDTIKYNMPRFKTLPQIAAGLYNDLERVSIRHYPVISEIKEVLMSHGAIGSLMSGSGPTVFGIFSDEESASKAESELKRTGIGSVCKAYSI